MSAEAASAGAASAVAALYAELLDGWNARSAERMTGGFEDEGHVVGYDGSQIDGREAIEAAMARIFADHQTAAYVAKVREVQFLTPDVALLRAVAGMVPPGQSDINPAVNSIQSLVAVRRGGKWRIALFQNTPAQFHGRPELVEQMTEELRRVLREGGQPAG